MKNLFSAFLVAVVLGFSSNVFAFGESKFEKEVKTETLAVNLLREVQRGRYGVITTEELHKAIEAGEDLLVIDTMPYEKSYKKNHIPGAQQFLFPIPEMAEWDTEMTGGRSLGEYESLLGEDKNKKIVIYCGFVKCTRSHNGALWASKLGYKNVFRHPGGIFAWKGAHYDIEKEL